VGQALLLTGRPGVGKTTVVRTVVASLGGCAGGFYTEEVREQKQRTGFRIVTLDGQTGVLASVSGSDPHRVGKYRVHVDDFERVGVEALRRALEEPSITVVVVDEIGKMELFSTAFQEMVQGALESPKPLLATVLAGSQPWVNDIKARPAVTVIRVTTENRQALPDRILRWLHELK
jgi:nucleoside-triphosphatase